MATVSAKHHVHSHNTVWQRSALDLLQHGSTFVWQAGAPTTGTVTQLTVTVTQLTGTVTQLTVTVTQLTGTVTQLTVTRDIWPVLASIWNISILSTYFTFICFVSEINFNMCVYYFKYFLLYMYRFRQISRKIQLLSVDEMFQQRQAISSKHGTFYHLTVCLSVSLSLHVCVWVCVSMSHQSVVSRLLHHGKDSVWCRWSMVSVSEWSLLDHDWPTVEPWLPTPLTTCVRNWM